jgi:hypothetical protein
MSAEERAAKNRREFISLATPGRDQWLCGYAAALGAVARLHHADWIVVKILNSDNLTPVKLSAAGAEKYDLTPIRQALRREKDRFKL